MSWALPMWLWGLAGVLALAGLVIAMGRHHRQRLSSVFNGALLERVWPASVRRRRVVRDVLMLFGMTCLVLALAEPRFGKQLQEIKADGVDLVLVVDLSSSMNAQDIDPSRLERARRKILDLIEMLEGDRVGLVIYAGGAYPRMPLTHDYRALELLVRELDTRTFQAQGSALDEAIRQAKGLLDNSDSDAGSAILVLTDGEVHRPDDAVAAGREAASAGIAVFGLIIGKEAAPIPHGDGTWVTDPSTRQRAMSTPTVDVMTEIARVSGGAVVQSVPSNMDIQRLYVEEIRGRVRAAHNTTTQREAWTTAFHWPLGLGVMLLIASSWIGDGRRRGLLAVMLLAFSIVSSAPAHAQSVREADGLYRDGKFSEAADMLTELSLESPDDADLLHRLAAARYRAGDYPGAARAFSRQAELTQDPDAEFNAGNAWYQSGELDQAVDRYQRALEMDPEHPGATANQQLVASEIQQRRLQQQQQQQQGEQGDQSEDQQQGEQSEDQQQGDQSESQDQQGEQGEQQESDGEQQEQSEGQQQQQQGDQSEDQQPSDQQQQDGTSGESPEDDGTRGEEEGEDAQTKLEDVDGEDEQSEDQQGEGEGEETEDESEGDGSASGSAEDGQQGDMSAAQADRVLDGVEEGRPRVVVPGERGEKPW